MKKEVASFQRRIIAYFIDKAILIFLILSPFKLLSRNLKSFTFSREAIIVSLSVSLIILLYFALLELTLRQTIGKMILQIYVSSKKELTLKQALIRNVSKIADIILAIDVLYAFTKKTHQRYFETIAKTEVLRVPSK